MSGGRMGMSEARMGEALSDARLRGGTMRDAMMRHATMMRDAVPTPGELAYAMLMTVLLLCACASFLGVDAP